MVKKKAKKERISNNAFIFFFIIFAVLMVVVSFVIVKNQENSCIDNLGQERDYSYETIGKTHYNCCWREPEIVIDRHDSKRWELIEKCEAFEK